MLRTSSTGSVSIETDGIIVAHWYGDRKIQSGHENVLTILDSTAISARIQSGASMSPRHLNLCTQRWMKEERERRDRDMLGKFGCWSVHMYILVSYRRQESTQPGSSPQSMHPKHMDLCQERNDIRKRLHVRDLYKFLQECWACLVQSERISTTERWKIHVACAERWQKEHGQLYRRAWERQIEQKSVDLRLAWKVRVSEVDQRELPRRKSDTNGERADWTVFIFSMWSKRPIARKRASKCIASKHIMPKRLRKRNRT